MAGSGGSKNVVTSSEGNNGGTVGKGAATATAAAKMVPDDAAAAATEQQHQQRYTLPFDSPSCTLASCGGKGHNLSLLSRTMGCAGLQIPPGFVVTVDAYKDFVTTATSDCSSLVKDIETAVQRLWDHQLQQSSSAPSEQAAAQPLPPELLDEVSECVRASFQKRSLPGVLQTEISKQLTNLLNDFDYVAVRSSATCEDLPDASFAGQHDTYLNVNARNVDEVCRRVVDCMASLFTSRAVAYRERNKIGHTPIGDDEKGAGGGAMMAVVVQAMVASESSGVLFTANPLTGRRTESVLEVVPGLGEALVSGITEPDRYVVVAARRDDAGEDDDDDGTRYEIIDTRIGSKLKSIRPVSGGGVKEEVVVLGDGGGDDGLSSAKPALDEATVIELVKLGRKIESLYGDRGEGGEDSYSTNPQDIEWARSADGTVYIVQSRPVTTLFPVPSPVPGEKAGVFFSFGAVQGFSDPIYPSGQDAVKSLIRGGVEWISWGRKGKEGDYGRVVAERLYGNMTRVIRNSIGRKVLRKLLPAMEPGVLAGLEQEVLDNPQYEVDSGMSPIFFFGAMRWLSNILPRFIFAMMFPDRSRQLYIDAIENFVAQVKEDASKVNNLREAVELKEKTFKRTFPAIIPMAMPRVAAGNAPLLLLTRLASSIPDGKDLVMTITRGLPHNVTTEMDLKLWDVAKVIRGDGESSEYFRSSDADVLAADYLAERQPGAAQQAIQPFMDEYGMRGLCEIDFGRPRWREVPAQLMQTLKSYIEIDDEHAPCRLFAMGEEAAVKAIERLGRETKKPWIVSFLAQRVRALAGLRELHKFGIIRYSGILREMLLEEGNKLVREGVLEDPRGVFLLRDDELRELADSSLKAATDWKALVADRQATMDRESERKRVPRLLLSDGFGFYGGSTKLTAEQLENPNILVGEPVSPGTVEGMVRVVHDPSKTALQPGEVLVCHGTDPSWTPLFLSACSLVMEVGGMMTHGSVVAREYGIPAVVGIESVTDRLRTGQRIRVDGSSGVVEILDDQE